LEKQNDKRKEKRVWGEDGKRKVITVRQRGRRRASSRIRKWRERRSKERRSQWTRNRWRRRR
jgi:hypothetical protein